MCLKETKVHAQNLLTNLLASHCTLNSQHNWGGPMWPSYAHYQ